MLPNSYITIPLLLKKNTKFCLQQCNNQWNYPCSFQSDYDFYLYTCDNKEDGNNKKKTKNSFSYATNKLREKVSKLHRLKYTSVFNTWETQQMETLNRKMYNFVYCIYSFYNALIRILVDKIRASFTNLDLSVTMSYFKRSFSKESVITNYLFILKQDC